MAKRFTDTEKWKKPFVKGLQGVYKLLWFYILDDCDHAGIWQVDLDVAAIRIGEPTISQDEALRHFGSKIVVIDNGEKWFIPDFIEFQYNSTLADLNPNSKIHGSAIKLLKKFGLLEKNENQTKKEKEENKGFANPLQSVKDKDKYKDKEKDMDIEGGTGETLAAIKVEEAEEINESEYVPNVEFPEEEFAAAMEFYKSQQFYAITRKQYSLDEKTIDDYFRRFYEKRFGELMLERKRLIDAYKTQMELIKHFYNQLPYLKKTIAETTPKTQTNGNSNIARRQPGNSSTNAEDRRADRGKLNIIASAVLLGAQSQERTG